MVFKRFSKDMQNLIKERGFDEPTLTQKLGIPEILEGKNVLIIAPTSSGKTESAMLPIFDLIHKKKTKPISVLYITPLRSLNRDMLKRLHWWCDKLDLDITVRHGDTSQQERAFQRETPSDIFITTPETLGAILPGKKMRKHLKNVRFVIVDEIHEICESKRGVQLSTLLERLKRISGNFQRIGLSATVGSPKKVAEFLGKNVRIVRADAEKKIEIDVELPKRNEKDATIGDNLLIMDSTASRLRRINEIINNYKAVLVFTNTRQTAELISSRLRQFNKELVQDVHHSSVSKKARIKMEQEFKEGKLKALVCTSSLELGIDIGNIDMIIQYLSPRQVTKIIQRVGRAGHTIKEKSKGIILTESGDDVFESSVIAKRALERKLEDIKIHETAWDVLASQIVGMSLEQYGIDSKTIFSVIKNAYPFRKLKERDFIEFLKFLAELRLIWLNPVAYDKDGKPIRYELRRTRNSWKYYYENLSTIPDVQRYKVISIIERELVGYLDDEFVAEYGKPGNSFVFRGRLWRIVSVENDKVVVEPSDDIQSAIPAWEGELIPVPLEVSKEVGNIRVKISEMLEKKREEEIIRELRKEYPVNREGAEDMIKTIKKQKKFFVPHFNHWLLEQYQDFIILHTCAGSLINDTLGRYISAIVSEETGVSVQMKTDPYRIILRSFAKPEMILRILRDAHKKNDLKDVLLKNLERSTLFKWRFIHVAKRIGILSRKTQFQNYNLSKIISLYCGSAAYEETIREILKEKMDIENTKKILCMIENEKIRIKFLRKLTPLGKTGLLYQFSEVMKPETPKYEIFRAFKRRLLQTKVRLVCTHCANYSVVKSVKNIEDQPVCPKCHSGLIAVVSKFKNPIQLLKREKLSKDDKKIVLTKKEKKEIEKIKRSASLTITYGKRFAFVQAARGVGPEIGARILAKLPKDEEQLLKYIFEAEQQYQKNKKYWKE